MQTTNEKIIEPGTVDPSRFYQCPTIEELQRCVPVEKRLSIDILPEMLEREMFQGRPLAECIELATEIRRGARVNYMGWSARNNNVVAERDAEEQLESTSAVLLLLLEAAEMGIAPVPAKKKYRPTEHANGRSWVKPETVSGAVLAATVADEDDEPAEAPEYDETTNEAFAKACAAFWKEAAFAGLRTIEQEHQRKSRLVHCASYCGLESIESLRDLSAPEVLRCADAIRRGELSWDVSKAKAA